MGGCELDLSGWGQEQVARCVNTAKNLWISKNAKNFLIRWRNISF